MVQCKGVDAPVCRGQPIAERRREACRRAGKLAAAAGAADDERKPVKEFFI